MNDVYISHAQADRGWVMKELMPRIEQTGFTVWIDSHDYRPGEPFLEETERAIAQSRNILLVLTPAYIETTSSMMERVGLRDMGPYRRLHVLLKERCEFPPWLKPMVYVDFTETADHELAWQHLLKALDGPQELAEALPYQGWSIRGPRPSQPNFTGRDSERAVLTRWLTSDAEHPLLLLTGAGGMGKTALAWYWLINGVDQRRWPRAVWWSFYDHGATFESFVSQTLAYLEGSTGPLVLSSREQVDALLALLRARDIVLVLDGFEQLLQDSERTAISPNADAFLHGLATLPALHAKVLVTTRVRPAAVESPEGHLLPGCREEVLAELPTIEALDFLRAQGVRGSRTLMQTSCEALGNHPLSLSLLAGLVMNDRERPGDIGAARKQLDATGGVEHRRNVVLRKAYDALPPDLQRFLKQLACFRGTASYDALRDLAPMGEGTLNAALHQLTLRGLIDGDREKGFGVHPIFRHYAYEQLTADERTQAHDSLSAYFERITVPEHVASLDELQPVIELYHHIARAGRYEEARNVYRRRLAKQIFGRFRAYSLAVELLRELVPTSDEKPQLGRTAGLEEMMDLGLAYELAGQPRAADAMYERVIPMLEGHPAVFRMLVSRAAVKRLVGEPRAAAAFLERAFRIEGADNVAIAHTELGRVHAERGAWEASEASLAAASSVYEKSGDTEHLSVVWAHRAWRELLERRTTSASKNNPRDARSAAERALDLLDRNADKAQFPIYVRAQWLLGASNRLSKDGSRAGKSIHAALVACRRLNLVELEADILIELAHLELDAAWHDEARRYATEALAIATRCGYVMQAADAHLALARIADSRGDETAVRSHATEALRLATCDGPPDYTYKAAYVEASNLLAQIDPQVTAPEHDLEPIRRIAASPESVARLLASIVFRHPTLLALLEVPSTSRFLDALSKQQALAMPALAQFIASLGGETAAFEPHPLWLAWVVRIHPEPLRDIGAELLRLAEGPGPEPRT